MLPSELHYRDAPASFQLIASEIRANHRILGTTPASIYIIVNGQIDQRELPPELLASGNKWMVEKLMVEAARSGSEAVALVSEAWMVDFRDDMADQEQIMADAQSQSIHKRSDKIEVLTLSYNSSELAITAIAKIDGKSVQGWTLMGGDQGRFQDIYSRV